MSKIKRIRTTQRIRWGTALVIFLAVNIVLRFSIVWINQAEYTDGIIQLTQFDDLTGIYPPLYTAICWPFSFLMGQLWAGRVVSTLFSTAALIPLFLIARRSFGMRCAVFTALVYTVAPVALRWSPRVMTDAMFSFFFWFACERLVLAQAAKEQKDCDRALVHAGILGTLAALTRYQGLLFVVPIVVIVAYKWYRRGWFAWRGLLAVALFAAVPAWSVYAGNIHGEQFLERTAILGPWMTFLLSAEPFFLYIPYFLTYPVAILAMLGAMAGKARERYALTPITLYVFVVLLVFQSLFSSFQERYFLPLYGLLFVWAGLGMAVIDDRCRRRYPRLRPYTPIVMTVWSATIAAFVLIGGREAFGDLRQGAEFAGEFVRERDSGMIYTNEMYRRETDIAPALGGQKVAFFAKQEVTLLTESHFFGHTRLAAGDVVVLTSRDGGTEHHRLLSERYVLRELQTFQSTIIPIFPDLMQNRALEQSPAAWLYRYVPQLFSTTVYLVETTR